MKTAILILFSLFSNSLKSQFDSSLLFSFFNTDQSIFYSKENIPKTFYKAYKRISKRDFLIADSGELFNPTDVVYSGIPNKKLLFGGIDKTKRIGFILFSQGGLVVTSHVLLFDITLKKNPKFFGVYLEKEPENFGELKLMLSKVSKFRSKNNNTSLSVVF